MNRDYIGEFLDLVGVLAISTIIWVAGAYFFFHDISNMDTFDKMITLAYVAPFAIAVGHLVFAVGEIIREKYYAKPMERNLDEELEEDTIIPTCDRATTTLTMEDIDHITPIFRPKKKKKKKQQ